MPRNTDTPQIETRLKSPVIIAGCPRSGTTLLGSLFAAHPEVAYWEEPRTVWSLGNSGLPDDVLTEGHLTPVIARRIDERFFRFLQQSGKPRFAEKTPSNMLRLRFVHALYPDCRIIHLCRDPRPVVASMLRMLESPPRGERMWARLRETPLRGWPSLASLFCRDVIGRRLRGGRKAFWGPRPPGWRDWLSLRPVTMLARQWRVLEITARRDLQTLPAECRMEIRYEDLLASPERLLPELFAFAGLEPSPEAVTLARNSIEPARATSWKESLTPELIAQINQEAGELLVKLGYPLDP